MTLGQVLKRALASMKEMRRCSTHHRSGSIPTLGRDQEIIPILIQWPRPLESTRAFSFLSSDSRVRPQGDAPSQQAWVPQKVSCHHLPVSSRKRPVMSLFDTIVGCKGRFEVAARIAARMDVHCSFWVCRCVVLGSTPGPVHKAPEELQLRGQPPTRVALRWLCSEPSPCCAAPAGQKPSS